MMNLVVTWMLLIAPNTDPYQSYTTHPTLGYIPLNAATQPALDPCSCCPSAAAGSLQPCLLLSALGSVQREGGASARYTDCSRSPVVQPCRHLPSHSLPMAPWLCW